MNANHVENSESQEREFSMLIDAIKVDFASRFVGYPRVFLPRKKADRVSLNKLGISMSDMVPNPDVIIQDQERDWLFFFDIYNDAETQIDEVRYEKLAAEFAACDQEVLFFSVFKDRQSFANYSEFIAWKTHVWIADAPDHMIHYTGERLLGPYSFAPPASTLLIRMSQKRGDCSSDNESI